MTHYVPWDEPKSRGIGRAVCGVQTRHTSDEPSCPTCAQWLAERERQTVAERFGQEKS